jgi:hypothetical protein
MDIRYERLSRNPKVFRCMTGLLVEDFDELVEDLQPMYAAAEKQRLERPGRRRGVGGGHPFRLDYRNQVLACVIWLRLYPTHEVLGYLLGMSATSVGRLLERLVPLLEQAGKDTMRRPDPGRKHRRQWDELLKETPELAVLVDSFEQRVQRPQVRRTAGDRPDRREADSYYSGKKQQHTIKCQVAVDERTGCVVDIADSVPGRTADLTLLKQSDLLQRLPPGVGALGDLAYVSMAKFHPQGLAATPRRKPRGKERPDEDKLFNQAFSRRRVLVEHTIGRLRRFQSLTPMDRHHRKNHTQRTLAVAGLVNRHMRANLPC